MIFVQRCCHCGQVKAIAESDPNPKKGKDFAFHFCYSCLGQPEPESNKDHPHTSVRQLSAKQVEAMGKTPEAIVLAAVGINGSSRTQINSAIRSQLGSYLKPALLEKTILALVKSGRLECKNKRYIRVFAVACK